MTERLTELLRQRALIQEHLAWLDHEIATEQGLSASPHASPGPSMPPPIPAKIDTPINTSPTKPLNAKDEAEAENIIGQFRADPNALKTDTRRGCLTAFALALGLLALLTFIAYWLYARHLGRWW